MNSPLATPTSSRSEQLKFKGARNGKKKGTKTSFSLFVPHYQTKWCRTAAPSNSRNGEEASSNCKVAQALRRQSMTSAAEAYLKIPGSPEWTWK
jgi:hypothetical protein